MLRSGLLEQFEHIAPALDATIGCRRASRAQAEQGLKGSHRLPAPIVPRRGTRWSFICTTQSAAFSAGGIRSPGPAAGSSRRSACSGNWAWCLSTLPIVGVLCMPPCEIRPRAG